MSQKEKFALYLTPEMKARLERRYQEDGSRSLTGFIENAINFYLDYLSANNAGMFLPVSVQSYLDGRLDQLEKRVSSLLFKQAVELDQGVSVLADCVHLDEEYLRKKHAESVARVKKLNGHLQLEQMAKQKEFRAIRNAVIREAENIRLGKITFEDEKREERGEWVDNWEVSYDCLRLRAEIEDNKLPLDQRDEAVEDLERLAEYGDVHAQYFLGLLYRDGGLLLPDAQQAAYWLELAAKRNLPAAQYALGKLYHSDDPEVHDVGEGIRWLERAVRNGNPDAAYRLGKEYLTGKSVQKDAVKAAEYLRHAADQNHPWANYLLGKLYLTGNGVPKDDEAAWNCFRMADAYGHPCARYVLERQDQWHQPQLLLTVSRLLYHMSNIFQDNAPAPPAQPRLHIDRKRMRELQELRIALGHQPDDHEEEQTQTQSWGGMTMKGW